MKFQRKKITTGWDITKNVEGGGFRLPGSFRVKVCVICYVRLENLIFRTTEPSANRKIFLKGRSHFSWFFSPSVKCFFRLFFFFPSFLLNFHLFLPSRSAEISRSEVSGGYSWSSGKVQDSWSLDHRYCEFEPRYGQCPWARYLISICFVDQSVSGTCRLRGMLQSKCG